MWPYKVIDNFLSDIDFMLITDNMLRIKANDKVERQFFHYDPTPQIADLLKVDNLVRVSVILNL